MARPLLLPGALSLLAVALGAYICAVSGIPVSIWARNPVAWLVGALLAAGLARAAGVGSLYAVLAAALIALSATFLNIDQLGVHRWIAVGPVQLNAAMLLLPPAIVAIAALCSKQSWVWAPALAGLALLVLQPDASQATAFGAALVCIAWRSTQAAWMKLAISGASLLAIGLAWLRPDPLEPVPEVEEILQLAWDVFPLLAIAGFATLVLTALAPGYLARRLAHPPATAGMALSLYFIIAIAAPFIGAFPVPLMGAGVSPVLGYWLGVGALAALLRTAAKSPETM